MRVTLGRAAWYLEGWCHRAEDVRLFRIDRVVRAEVLEVDGTPPAGAVGPRRGRRAAVHAVPGRPGGHPRPRPRGPVGGRVLPGRGGRGAARTAGCGSGCGWPTPGWVPRLVLRLGGAGRGRRPRSWPAQSDSPEARSPPTADRPDRCPTGVRRAPEPRLGGGLADRRPDHPRARIRTRVGPGPGAVQGAKMTRRRDNCPVLKRVAVPRPKIRCNERLRMTRPAGGALDDDDHQGVVPELR